VAMIDLADETFIVASREDLAAIVHDRGRWQKWWPDLELVVFMDRGLDGIRWSAVGDPTGSVEIWLEPAIDGVLVHHYLRLDPGAAGSSSRTENRAARMRRKYATAWKRSVWALKDALEGDRVVGAPRLLAGSGD